MPVWSHWLLDLPGSRRVVHARLTVRACGQEVTVGDALGIGLVDLRVEMRHRIGTVATSMPDACDEIVDTVLRWWPERTMADVARHGDHYKALDAIPVIGAKVREDLEARWGTDTNTLQAIDALVMTVVVEMANIWFSGRENRIELRRCMTIVRDMHSA
jgi:hypothetical protein